MRRRPNTRSTSIYWLVDTRPETVSLGWPSGKPFYCGKTVDVPCRRLGKHKATAAKFPKRPLCSKLLECGESVRINVVEVVPPGADWAVSERRWIEKLRSSFPDTVNVSNGGDGPAGVVRTPEFKARISKALTGKKLSPQHRANMRAANIGKTISPEQRAKISATKMGHKHSAETRAKISAGLYRRAQIALF